MSHHVSGEQRQFPIKRVLYFIFGDATVKGIRRRAAQSLAFVFPHLARHFTSSYLPLMSFTSVEHSQGPMEVIKRRVIRCLAQQLRTGKQTGSSVQAKAVSHILHVYSQHGFLELICSVYDNMFLKWPSLCN